MDRSMLSRATEGTQAPTPGYLYVDLAKAATANPVACQEMAKYLTNRLVSKNNPNIKYKCCKVIAKLCESVPRNQFRRCLSQDPAGVAAIKETMHYRGTMDPVRGDEPNQKVRIAAKEALDAIYRESTSSEMAAVSHSHLGASYAPSPHAAASQYGGPSAGGRRMDGIGNPMFTDPRLDPRYNGSAGANPNFTTVVKEASEVIVGMIKDPLARNLPYAGGVAPPASSYQHPSQGHSGNLPGYGNNSSVYGRPPPGQAELSRQTGGKWNMATNRGPGAVQPPPNYGRDADYYKSNAAGNQNYSWAHNNNNSQVHSASLGTVGGSWASASPTAAGSNNYATPSITITHNPAASVTAGSGGAPVSDGSYEKNLIMELCPPGGMKPVPPADKLVHFSRAVPSLNADLVCPVLLDLLEEGQPWVIRAKALCVMETCLQAGMKADGSNPYRDFFYACQEEIAPLAIHSRNAIQEPAKRVLHLLGVAIESIPAANGHGNSSSTPISAEPTNLLDFDDATPLAAPVDAPPVPPPPTPPPPPPPSAPALVTPSTNASLFGGMQVKAGTTDETAVSTTVPPPAPTSGNLLDFDSSITANGIPPPAPTPVAAASPAPHTAPPTDMFAQLNMANEDKKVENDQGNAVATTTSASSDFNFMATSGPASAFGFINQSSTKDGPDGAAAPAAVAVPPQPAPKESFDPLKNPTLPGPSPTAQRKMMMQYSPEQMQAMAYQQMMMQQQMQYMQHMAMAAAAAKVGGAPPGMFVPPAGMVLPATAASAAAAGRKPSMNNGVGGLNSGSNHGMAGGPAFQITRPAQMDDKKFDFVKDAMHTETKKK